MQRVALYSSQTFPRGLLASPMFHTRSIFPGMGDNHKTRYPKGPPGGLSYHPTACSHPAPPRCTTRRPRTPHARATAPLRPRGHRPKASPPCARHRPLTPFGARASGDPEPLWGRAVRPSPDAPRVSMGRPGVKGARYAPLQAVGRKRPLCLYAPLTPVRPHGAPPFSPVAQPQRPNTPQECPSPPRPPPSAPQGRPKAARSPPAARPTRATSRHCWVD